MTILIRSPRLRLSQFEMADADDVFACITPAIARFMPWEPPQSLREYKARRLSLVQSEDQANLSLVIRLDGNGECLGMAALDGIDLPCPELGLWIKEAAHGLGYGREAAAAVAGWASETLGKEAFTYAVATQNLPSRRIAESLGGRVVGNRTDSKYEAAVYNIPALRP